MSALEFIVIAIAGWRLAFFLTREEAPWRLMARFRERFSFGGLLSCIYCASVWTAVLCYLVWFTPLQPVIWMAALSGAGLMLAAYTGAGHA
jgi:hypothetical protein